MDISWTLGVSGDFATASNWNPGVIPGPGDDATIAVPGTYTVTSSIDETVDSLTITNTAATLAIDGTSTAFTTFTTQTAGVNDGTIALNDGEFGGNGGTLTNNHVIAGSGDIRGFALINNQVGGIIDATTGGLVFFFPAVIDNAGTLESTGGLLDFFGQGHRLTINNTPLGVIEANGANTQVQITSQVTIVGGTLETRGANAVINIAIDGVMLDGSQPGNPLNIDGNVDILNTTSVFVTGTINNTGEITEASRDTLSNAEIFIQGNATLEGGGDINLETVGPNPELFGSVISGGVLTNVDNVISGTGYIDSFLGFPANGILINEHKGIIDANASTPLILSGSSADTNSGLIEATQGATLLIENVTVDNFQDHTNGTILAAQGSTVGLEDATIVGGNIHVNGQLLLTGDVSLQGNGDLDLSGGVISGFGTLSTDSTISGSGTIGNVGGPILTNEATGVIDANDPNAPLIIDATPVKNTSLTNAGLLEATHGGTLLLSGIISNTTTGTVEADHGSTIGLEGGNIFGGTVTVLHGATIEAEQAAGTIFAAAVTNAGTIGAEGANLTIVGDVTNAKGNLDANNATLVIDGAVSGGKATLEGTGQIEFGGASSANVTFAVNSDAILKLDHQSVGDPAAFIGTVSGLNTGGFIDLTNINFADNPTLSYSSKTHVLTVTDNVSHVTDTITFKGAVGSFSAQSDGSGGTFITDPPPPATAELTTLVSFNGTNGSEPLGSLIADQHGDLFGTTAGLFTGGPNQLGTVFEIVNNGSVGAPSYASTPTTLVSFNGTNGSLPFGSLIADQHGDLFGTTSRGGANDLGTVFEIVNNGSVGAPSYASTPTTLVSFNDANAAFPAGSLIADQHGDLFGNTESTVFEIVNNGTVGAPSYASTPTTLVSFNNFTNGSGLFGSLIADQHGDLFGTTISGGAHGVGTVFEIVNNGSVGAPSYASTPTPLASFDGTNGAEPVGSLIADQHGDLFGTTQAGGANNLGTVFEIVNNGSVGAPSYASTPTTLVSFNGTNGALPVGSLIADQHGDLFGTTLQQANHLGTVFEIVNNGTVGAPSYASTPTTLVSFNGTNGSTPQGSLIADQQGDLFGTTAGGGANGVGTVFEITASGFGAHTTDVTDTITFKGAVGSFSAQSDGSGGTFITDPPPPANIVAASHDQFVFAPNLGENGGKATNANVQHNEPIDFLHQGGELADLAALMVQAHAEGAHLMAAPDAIDMHQAAALTAHHSLL